MDNQNPQNDDPDIIPEGIDEEIMHSNLNDPPAEIPEDTRDEETASELSAIDYDDSVLADDEDHNEGITNVNSFVGWAALALSVLSFFFLPIILGGAGIIVGFIARNRDSVWLGNTAIATGIISIILTLFIVPFI